MSSDTLSEAILQRDGTSQSQRQAAALHPDYIPVEERSLEDWLVFAQQYATELAFFNAGNHYTGTWEGFLTSDLKDLLAYIGNPGAFAGDVKKLRTLAAPHLVLFISFLKLLDHLKEQLNEFTKKHLDFYYYEILGLTRKGPVPDIANVIIELIDDVKELFVPQGTRLLAGRDSLDKDLVYETERDTLISRAAVQKIKTLYTGRKTTDLQQKAEDAAITDPDTRLLDMMELALGTPGPGAPLPRYKKLPVTIDTLKEIRQSNSKESTDYIYGQLFLIPEELTVLLAPSDPDWDEIVQILIVAYRRKLLKQVRKPESDPMADFQRILESALGLSLPPYPANVNAAINVINKEPSGVSDADWLKVYDYILDAQRAQLEAQRAQQPEAQKVQLPEPVKQEWEAGWADPDAIANAFTSGNGGDTTRCFNTFGKGYTSKERVGAEPVKIGFAIASPQLFLQEGERTITLTLDFKDDGTVDKVFDNSIQSPPDKPAFCPFSFYLSKAEGWFEVPGHPRDITTPQSGNAVRQIEVTLKLEETDPPVTAPVSPGDDIPGLRSVQSAHPVLAVIVDQPDTGQEKYALLRNLQLQNVRVQVDVRNLKALALQNDDMVLNYKKPFEPFGFSPETGSHFYFAHPEICSKPLNKLTLHFEWLNKPGDLATYYKNYWNYTDLPHTNLIAKEDAVKAVLELVEADLDAGVAKKVRLFSAGGTAVHIADEITLNHPAFAYRYEPVLPADEVINWERYFSLALGDPDFQHKIYPRLLSQQAFYNNQLVVAQILGNQSVPPLIPPLNPPYTPKLKSFAVDYTCSFEINTVSGVSNQEDRLLHIHPFGYETAPLIPVQMTELKKPPYFVYLLPPFGNEGELYIGISGVAAPQTLSLFFQLAEGSAMPDMVQPPVTWSYLSDNNWLPPKGLNPSFDSTNGLLNTGIIELSIPAEATCNNTLLPEGLYWLKASVTRNTEAIPDTVAVFTQAVSARFVDHENAAEHFTKPLPPDSIRETVENLPSIDKIVQPYSSLKGKPAETDDHLYTRASERLRHKGRALTMWDYEHMVLEQFPEIYKAKCIPSDDAGAVDLVVIPDIKGKLPFNPFQPKAAADVLHNIRAYLEPRVPAWATVRVRNPTYTQVKVRIAVKIKDGYSEGFFVTRLEEELIRYLAPWAYDEGAEIYLDRRIEADVIINFVAERFYIAYASDISLFSSPDGKDFIRAEQSNGGRGNYLQATRPGEILVSAPGHDIDIIQKEYIPGNYSGIGYMKIELDFRIGE